MTNPNAEALIEKLTKASKKVTHFGINNAWTTDQLSLSEAIAIIRQHTPHTENMGVCSVRNTPDVVRPAPARYDMADDALSLMGDASTRKDEGCATHLPSVIATSPANISDISIAELIVNTERHFRGGYNSYQMGAAEMHTSMQQGLIMSSKGMKIASRWIKAYDSACKNLALEIDAALAEICPGHIADHSAQLHDIVAVLVEVNVLLKDMVKALNCPGGLLNIGWVDVIDKSTAKLDAILKELTNKGEIK